VVVTFRRSCLTIIPYLPHALLFMILVVTQTAIRFHESFRFLPSCVETANYGVFRPWRLRSLC